MNDIVVCCENVFRTPEVLRLAGDDPTIINRAIQGTNQRRRIYVWILRRDRINVFPIIFDCGWNVKPTEARVQPS